VPVAEHVPASEATPVLQQGALKGRRILVVDDEEPARKVCELVFRDILKAKVDCCCSGGAALARMETERFDAVILDLFMPGLSGQEVFRRLRRAAQKTVVFLTGAALWSMTSDFLSSCAQPVLFKPVTASTLVAAVQQVMTVPKTPARAMAPLQ
jgi:CheY-like chemotaxis protein